MFTLSVYSTVGYGVNSDSNKLNIQILDVLIFFQAINYDFFSSLILVMKDFSILNNSRNIIRRLEYQHIKICAF